MKGELRIWFNQSLSSIHGVLRLLRSGWNESVDGRLIMLGSHSKRHFGPFVECDFTETEPSGLDSDSYVEWCLDFCRRRRVDVFIPGRRRDAIADRAGDFGALGTKLILAGDGNTLRLLEDKGRFLESLPSGVRTHRFSRAKDWKEVEHALAGLEGVRVCVKPATSTFGLGFYLLDNRMNRLRRFLASEGHAISLNELASILQTKSSFPELLVMEYLDGPEMSVDVLARSGEVIAIMARRKPKAGPTRISGTSRTKWIDEGPVQVLDRHLGVESMARELVSHFRLGGLLNIQFRSKAEFPDRFCVLEINGRMSGGLPYVGLSGLNLPLLAVKVALLSPGEPVPPIPEVRLPLRIGTRTEAFVVPEEPQ